MSVSIVVEQTARAICRQRIGEENEDRLISLQVPEFLASFPYGGYYAPPDYSVAPAWSYFIRDAEAAIAILRAQ